jgi:hypothetical protein
MLDAWRLRWSSATANCAGVLVIQLHREDVNRRYVAPGGWLEVVEMAEGQPIKMSRGIMGRRPL